MAAKKKQEPRVRSPIAAELIHRRYLQEVFNRTELERQMSMQMVRSLLGVPDEMVYNPQDGTFLVPPTAPAPVELLPDAS